MTALRIFMGKPPVKYLSLKCRKLFNKVENSLDVVWNMYSKLAEVICDYHSKIVEDSAQKMKFSIKDFFSKYDQSRRQLRIWSHLRKKFLMENFILCAV